MPNYRVVQTIVSGNPNDGEPVDVQFYKGGDLAQAIAAMTNGAASYRSSDSLPESLRTFVLGVALHVDADCPWRDVPRPQRPFWAKAACAGREVDTEVGTLCAVHHAAMRNNPEYIISERATSSTDDPQWAPPVDREQVEQVIRGLVGDGQGGEWGVNPEYTRAAVEIASDLGIDLGWCTEHNTHRPCPGCD